MQGWKKEHTAEAGKELNERKEVNYYRKDRKGGEKGGMARP